ncbi:MAG: amidohydrolase [Bacteroidia bacterium]
MKVTIVQSSLHWEDRDKNLEHFENLLNAKQTGSLIILPEMFTTGFTMKPETQSESHPGPSLAWMQKMTKSKNAVLAGSISVNDNGNFFNRLYWVEPSGAYKTYDKRHLFRMAKEDEHYTAGQSKIINSIEEWNVCPLICYDLRFPVWSRNRFNNGKWDYDVLIYVANWPELRSYPWKQLLIARAIENQCYVIGVNRVGADGNNITHSGDSMIIGPKGEILSKTAPNEESVETIQLDKAYLEEFRKAFPVGLDADDFTL